MHKLIRHHLGNLFSLCFYVYDFLLPRIVRAFLVYTHLIHTHTDISVITNYCYSVITYVSMLLYARTDTHAYTACVCMHVPHMHTCMLIHTHTYTCKIHAYIRIHLHTHTHMRARTRTHAYACALAFLPEITRPLNKSF